MNKRSGQCNFVSSVERAGRMSKLSPECSHRAGQLAEATLGEYIAAWGSHNSKIPSNAFSSGKGERADTFQVNGCKSVSGGAENKVTAAMEPRVICVVVLVFTLALSSLAWGQLETCDVDPHKRSNCGFSGITPSQCKDKGCCFDNTVRGVPWCFRPEPVDNPPEEECTL
ncbi:trefoil factor 1 isoform X5 [Crocuta crocuta]